MGAAFFVGRIIAKKRIEPANIDFGNPYINLNKKGDDGIAEPKCMGLSQNEHFGKLLNTTGLYEAAIKPALDKAMSLTGLVVFSPLMLVIALAVVINDSGPVFFSQKRVGEGGHYFMLHKFRTMKMSTPHDVPTHQLSEPEQYITRVGRVLRRTSLDELPQIWDIFRGKMSFIGPRPALWNQEDLVSAREAVGANGVLPGLTGLAQIKGRDELEINEKASLDGEYVRILRAGGVKAFAQDCWVLMSTLRSVIRHDGVVEGGTGSLLEPIDGFQGKLFPGISQADPADAGFEEYGYKKTFNIDKTARKRVLITGARSYIGESFKDYANEYYPNIEIVIIDMEDGSWRDYNFHGFDTVFHVSGIAHADVGKVLKEEEAKYYAVNCDLAIETGVKAKNSGVKQFIFMSSMIVYGTSASYGKEGLIDEHTIPLPGNFYGDSKWQADKGVRALATDFFRVAVLRSPMIYGRNSKGNYQTLAKMARKLPVFPDVDNCRSMLYIGNLCEFVALLTLSGEGGVYFPQNSTYTRTSEIIEAIADEAWHRIHITKLLNPAVWIASHAPGKVKKLVNKAFGNSFYDQRLSKYEGLDYQKFSFAESVAFTEGTEDLESEDYKELIMV